MHRRAELVDQTRLRITEATVRLHTTIGPASTSIAAIAEAAGVTRLTVYRHFPDPEELFLACTSHWSARHPGPDPAAWAAIPDLETRARTALRELYAWYGEVGSDLLAVHRDLEAWPPAARERQRAEDAALVEAIVGDAAPPGEQGTALRAVAGHLGSLFTWHSLVAEQGLTSDAAAELGVRWLLDAAQQGRTVPVDGRDPDARPAARRARQGARGLRA